MDIPGSTNHPMVDIFWNFFPFDFFIWAPAKWLLNIVTFTFWLPSIPVYEIYNIFPYTFLMAYWFFSGLAMIMLFMVLMAISGMWVFLTYLYGTSLPDQITVPIILTIVGSIVFGIVAGVYAIIAYE